MKSTGACPNYAGDPNNIQFLKGSTMDVNEHLAAHKGNYQNPANWYYNPSTGEYIYFDNYVPCN